MRFRIDINILNQINDILYRVISDYLECIGLLERLERHIGNMGH